LYARVVQQEIDKLKKKKSMIGKLQKERSVNAKRM
jgi:hypothetical protein